MRILVVDQRGVRFHSGMLKEEPIESYCSCSKIKSPRDIVMRNDQVFITIPNKEYVSIILRKAGSRDKPLHQRNPDGISIYTTDKFMVMVYFTSSYPSALQFIQKKNSLPVEEDKYIVSVHKIDKINTTGTKTTDNQNNNIFVYESSFGDVFSGNPFREDYTGEQTSADQQMFSNLKRSSYSTLNSSYPMMCWM